jgi:hypothetical protein
MRAIGVDRFCGRVVFFSSGRFPSNPLKKISGEFKLLFEVDDLGLGYAVSFMNDIRRSELMAVANRPYSNSA